MADNLSNYLEDLLLGKILLNSSYTPPTGIQIGLCTALSSDGDTYTEVSAVGTAYTRQSIAFSAASGGSISNSGAIAFPTATATWGTPTHWIIADGSDNLLYYGAIPSPLSVLTDEKFEIGVGDITISLSGSMSTALANLVLDSTLRETSWTLGYATHVGLISAYTSDASFTEVSVAEYDRQSVSWDAVSGGSSANSAQIQWDAASLDYTVAYVALFSALTSGNLLWREEVDPSKTVTAGKLFRITTGSLTVTIS